MKFIKNLFKPYDLTTAPIQFSNIEVTNDMCKIDCLCNGKQLHIKSIIKNMEIEKMDIYDKESNNLVVSSTNKSEYESFLKANGLEHLSSTVMHLYQNNLS